VSGAPPDDRGLLLGDGLFETVLYKAGRLVLWDAHLDRLTRGCAILGLPAPDPDALAKAARRAVTEAALGAARAAVRLSWTAGSGGRGLDRAADPQPRLLATAAPAPRPDTPARLVVSAIRRNERSPTSRIKSLAYLDNVLARREARALGADEALMLNSRGQIAGGAAANLFWIRDDRLFTPALACGVLDGVMRAAVLEAAAGAGLEAIETARSLADLNHAQAIFLTNSLIGVRPVCALGRRSIPEDPRVRALAEACGEIS
jgi:branched-chain amino acid aminotransferase/4-amino-4-deoxychorismate lyase